MPAQTVVASWPGLGPGRVRGGSNAAHWQNWKPLGICGRVGRAPARDALCRRFDPCRRRPRGLAADSGPTQSGWLIHQLGNPRLGTLGPPGWRGPPRRPSPSHHRTLAGTWPWSNPSRPLERMAQWAGMLCPRLKKSDGRRAFSSVTAGQRLALVKSESTTTALPRPAASRCGCPPGASSSESESARDSPAVRLTVRDRCW